MPRVKGGPSAHKRHKKILKLAKGYRGSRSKLYKRAKEATIRAGEHAFAGRKIRKRDIRRLWIKRLNAALTPFEIQYSRFIAGLKKSKIDLNRKMLSEIALNDPEGFKEIVEKVKKNL
ncbi:50S ribosomal protein L20 [Patescibacteria group bacterium]|nr:50S ribosomal protein L20 [Patescibacteria group bacterium]